MVKCIVHIFLLMLFIVLAGCQRDIPEPESDQDKSSGPILENNEVRAVASSLQSSPFEVRYQITGGNVLIECKLHEVSFRRDHPNKQIGKMEVSVDGKKMKEVDSPVFIIKGLSPGNHTITLQVVDLMNHPYPLKKELQIVMPNK